MTSAINAGTINVNYPTPGVNNSSQGLRDNFSGIKENFITTASEITALQSSVLLKQALSGSTLNNDMNNGLIKNAQTLGFRSSTYNLGTNSGTLNIDLTLGDVQYGTLSGDTTLTFSKWAPTDTYSSVQVVLEVVAGQRINLPATANTGVIYGVSTISYYDPVSKNITVPAGVTRLHLQFNSLDCGDTIEITTVDYPRQATQIYNTTPPTLSTDSGITGQIAFDNNFLYFCVANNTWKRASLLTW